MTFPDAVLPPDEDEGSMTLEAAIDLYDTERLAIRDRVLPAINAMVGSKRNVQGFVDEVINRFHQDAGLLVEVTVWENEVANASRAPQDRLYGFKFYIHDRVKPEGEFDHDRMRHEVRSDVLGLRGGDNRTNAKVSMSSPDAGKSKLWVPGSPN